MNSLLVSGNQHGEINIYDVNTSSAIYSKKLFNTSSTAISNVSYIHIDNTNNNLITCTARTDNTLNVLDMRMNRLVCNNRLNCGNILHTCNESKYGYIIVYGSNKLGKVMNVNSGFKDQHQLETSTNVTCGDTDDGFICVGCEDGCILGYELTRFESVFGYRSEERGKVHQCKLDKDSMNIYTAGDDGNVKCLQCINNEI
jgi:WD40 repeat protein